MKTVETPVWALTRQERLKEYRNNNLNLKKNERALY